MLKANALFIVLVIALVIGILCSSLILIAYHHRHYIQENILLKKLENNANSSINLLLSEENLIGINQEKTLDLYQKEEDSVTIKRSGWGLFEVGCVKAFSGKYHVVKSMQYGYMPDNISTSAIYLTDQNRPLSISGKTVINGDCYLPEAGITRAYIEGKSYEGNALVNGTVKRSKSTLPVLNKVILEYLVEFIKSDKESLGENFELSSGIESDSMIRSFLEKTLVVFDGNSFTLAGKNYSGNIIFCSKKLITIEAGSNLQDVIIFAGAVKVAKDFKGNIQAFATDSIWVDDNVLLGYPSALGLFKMDFKVNQPFIYIGKNASITGLVFTSQNVFDLNQTLIHIDKGAKVSGQVYSDGFVDIKGIVHGNITCNKFRLKTPSSLYENHLMDAEIDNSKLSSFYIGSSLINSTAEKSIIKWLE